MIAEAIQKIRDLDDKAKLFAIDGRTYVDGQLKLLPPPLPSPVDLATLTGLSDFLSGYPGGLQATEWFLEVTSYKHVMLHAYAADTYGQRQCLANCWLKDGNQFEFDQFLERERFVIGLMSRFVETPELTQLVKLVSTLTNEGVTQSDDDGVSQKTAVRQGISLKATVDVRPRWTLQPYRTFREIVQPVSQFLLRLRAQPGQVPTCALFEADGGRWKLDAALAIKQWLVEQRLGLNIVA